MWRWKEGGSCESSDLCQPPVGALDLYEPTGRCVIPIDMPGAIIPVISWCACCLSNTVETRKALSGSSFQLVLREFTLVPYCSIGIYPHRGKSRSREFEASNATRLDCRRSPSVIYRLTCNTYVSQTHNIVRDLQLLCLLGQRVYTLMPESDAGARRTACKKQPRLRGLQRESRHCSTWMLAMKSSTTSSGRSAQCKWSNRHRGIPRYVLPILGFM